MFLHERRWFDPIPAAILLADLHIRNAPMASQKHSRAHLDWDPVTHYQKVEIARRYDQERFSRLTGRLFHRLECHFVRRAFRTVPRGSCVIDVPCGTGRLAKVLLEDGFAVVGVDISPAMLEVAREKLGATYGDQFRTLVADVREISPLEHGTFDAALCARVLMHFPVDQQIEFLSGVSRMTSGPIIFTQSLDTPYQRARRRVKRMIGNPPSARYPVSEPDLERLLRGAGLREVARHRPMPLLTEEIIVVARRNESRS